jgi:hypothetical protein
MQPLRAIGVGDAGARARRLHAGRPQEVSMLAQAHAHAVGVPHTHGGEIAAALAGAVIVIAFALLRAALRKPS